MTVFDDNGHVELDSYDTMTSVLKEVYEGQLGKWRGSVDAHPTTGDPGYTLALNPEPDRLDRPGFSAFIGDHLQKVEPYGIILKITAADYTEYQPQ